MLSPSPLPSGFWRNQLRQWHWISSALCLMGLLLFSVTGFTLNHASKIEAKPQTVRIEKDLPSFTGYDKAVDKQPVPRLVAAGVGRATGIDISRIPADVSDDEIFIDLDGPGVDASVTIDKADGHVSYERTNRGAIAVLNDLHKGRHTGAVWSLFIDILAVACVVFSITGFGLLWLYAKNRSITWPLIAAGLLLPFILFMVFVHA